MRAGVLRASVPSVLCTGFAALHVPGAEKSSNMTPGSVKFYFVQKKSLCRSRRTCIFSFFAFQNFLKKFSIFSHTLKINQASCNRPDHFPQKGIRFNLKNKVFAFIKKMRIINITEHRNALVAGRGKSRAVNFAMQTLGHLIQFFNIRSVMNRPDISHLACKRFSRIYKISVNPARCISSGRKILVNHPCIHNPHVVRQKTV